MNLTLACPSCQQSLRVPESLLGQSVKCPSCLHIFTAPDQVEDEAPQRTPAEQPSDDFKEPRPSPRRRDRQKPGKVQAIAILILVGGIFACISAFGWTLLSGFTCCLWPGMYYSLVMGIMAIVKGSNLLNENAYRLPAPQGIAIMMIINIINSDLVNLTLGILVLVFLADEEVKAYFRG